MRSLCACLILLTLYSMNRLSNTFILKSARGSVDTSSIQASCMIQNGGKRANCLFRLFQRNIVSHNVCLGKEFILYL